MEILSTIWSYIYVIAAVIFLFGAAVFVHEFGHFWVARKRGMKVEAFAIGFGPKIFGWTKDGIEYSWRWIPAGGFVKLPQMITSEAIEGSNKGEPIPPASPLSRILVAVAGPLMNVIFAFVIATVIYFVGLPVLVNPSVIGFVDPKSPEYEMGIRGGDRIVEIGGNKVRTWEKILQTTAIAHTNVLPVVIERSGQRTTYQLQTKSSAVSNLRILNLEPQEHPTVMRVRSGTPAEAVGVQPKDIIRSFAGVPVLGTEHFVELVQARPELPSELVLLRGPEKQKVSLMVTPKYDADRKKGFVGIELGQESKYEVQKPGPTPIELVGDIWHQTIGVFSALMHPKQTGITPKDLSGPIGIFAMLSIHVNIDYRLALKFLVLLNINLAILNMMPLPVLDGGHVVMAMFESVFRRPIPVKLQEYATTVFAVLLLSFMLFVSYHDLGRIPLFRSMFKQDIQVEQQRPSVPSDTN